jgi:hypothetical protein
MFDKLLLRPSLHCNTPLHFTTLHPTSLHYTYRNFISYHLHFTTLSFRFTHLHFLSFCLREQGYWVTWILLTAKRVRRAESLGKAALEPIIDNSAVIRTCVYDLNSFSPPLSNNHVHYRKMMMKFSLETSR